MIKHVCSPSQRYAPVSVGGQRGGRLDELDAELPAARARGEAGVADEWIAGGALAHDSRTLHGRVLAHDQLVVVLRAWERGRQG